MTTAARRHLYLCLAIVATLAVSIAACTPGNEQQAPTPSAKLAALRAIGA